MDEDSYDEGDQAPVFIVDEGEEDSEALRYLLAVRDEEQRLSVSSKCRSLASPPRPAACISLLSLPVSESRIQAVTSRFHTLRSSLESASIASPVDYQKGSKSQWWTYFNDPVNQPWADYTLRFSHTLTLRLIAAMTKWAVQDNLPQGYEVWVYALLAIVRTPLLADTEGTLNCLGKVLARDMGKEGHLVILVVITHYFRLKIWVD